MPRPAASSSTARTKSSPARWWPSKAKPSGKADMASVDPTVINLVVFVLAVFVGYHVIWNVTPALHTPLMSVTNAISSVIIVGAILAAAPADTDFGSWLGVVAVALAAVNVAGGGLVSQRMLEMFLEKKRPPTR